MDEAARPHDNCIYELPALRYASLMRPLQIGVAGSASENDAGMLMQMAEDVGTAIAQAGATLIFGGSRKEHHLPNAAYRGAHAHGGIAVAVVEGNDRALFDAERTILLPCGEHGRAWERAMAHPCDALIVIGGKEGTFEEMKTAHANGAVIIAMKGSGGMADAWIGRSLDEHNSNKVIGTKTPEEAVQKALRK